jgi:hypothetical protein
LASASGDNHRYWLNEAAIYAPGRPSPELQLVSRAHRRPPRWLSCFYLAIIITVMVRPVFYISSTRASPDNSDAWLLFRPKTSFSFQQNCQWLPACNLVPGRRREKGPTWELFNRQPS